MSSLQMCVLPNDLHRRGLSKRPRVPPANSPGFFFRCVRHPLTHNRHRIYI